MEDGPTNVIPAPSGAAFMETTASHGAAKAAALPSNMVEALNGIEDAVEMPTVTTAFVIDAETAPAPAYETAPAPASESAGEAEPSRKRSRDEFEDDGDADNDREAEARRRMPHGLHRPRKQTIASIALEDDDEADGEGDGMSLERADGDGDDADADAGADASADAPNRKDAAADSTSAPPKKGKKAGPPDLEAYHSTVIRAPEGKEVPSRHRENLKTMVRFPLSTPLKSALDRCRSLGINDIPFSIVRKPNFTGIVIYALESSRACLVYATIDNCSVSFYDDDGNEDTTEEITVTRQIDIRVMFTHLSELKTNVMIDLFCYNDAARGKNPDGFYLDWYVHENQLDESNVFIPFLDVDIEENQAMDCVCKYRVDMDVGELVNLLKMATGPTAYNTSIIRLEILTPRKKPRDNIHVSVIRFTIESERGTFVKKNVSVFEMKDNVGMVPTRVCDPAMVSDDNLETVMNEEFAASLILRFLKGMRGDSIQLQLENNLPLIATYLLDGSDSNSKVQFILAPKLKED